MTRDEEKARKRQLYRQMGWPSNADEVIASYGPLDNKDYFERCFQDLRRRGQEEADREFNTRNLRNLGDPLHEVPDTSDSIPEDRADIFDAWERRWTEPVSPPPPADPEYQVLPITKINPEKTKFSLFD